MASLTVHCAQNECCQLLDGVPGAGALTASAIAAALPDCGVFKSGREANGGCLISF